MTLANSLHRYGPAVMALGLACLTGCQSTKSQQQAHQQTSQEISGTDHGAKITANQAADVQISLGRASEARGDYDAAMESYQEAVKRDPKRADAYVRMAILFDRKGKFQDSAQMYQKALEKRPGDPEIFCDKGYSLYLQRRWAEAEMNLRQALLLKPDHARAHNNLGLVLAHDSKNEQAIAEFRKGGCSEADCHVNLAVVMTLEGDWTSARQEFAQALSVDPSSQAAKQGLHELNNLVAKTTPAKSTNSNLARTGYVKAPIVAAANPPRTVAPQDATVSRANLVATPPAGTSAPALSAPQVR